MVTTTPTLSANKTNSSGNSLSIHPYQSSRISKEQLAIVLALWAQRKPDCAFLRGRFGINLSNSESADDLQKDKIIPPCCVGACLLNSKRFIVGVEGSGTIHAAAALCLRFPEDCLNGILCMSHIPCTFCLKLITQVGISKIIVNKQKETESIFLPQTSQQTPSTPKKDRRNIHEDDTDSDDEESNSKNITEPVETVTEKDEEFYFSKDQHNEPERCTHDSTYNKKCKIEPNADRREKLKELLKEKQKEELELLKGALKENLPDDKIRETVEKLILGYWEKNNRKDLTLALQYVWSTKIEKKDEVTKVLMKDVAGMKKISQNYEIEQNTIDLLDARYQLNAMLLPANVSFSEIRTERHSMKVFKKLEAIFEQESDKTVAWIKGLTILTSLRSEDPEFKVGAVLVSIKPQPIEPIEKVSTFNVSSVQRIIVYSVGYNGFKVNALDNDYSSHSESKGRYAIHAEQNCMLFRSRHTPELTSDGMFLYTTHSPCFQCSQFLWDLGFNPRNTIYINIYREFCLLEYLFEHKKTDSKSVTEPVSPQQMQQVTAKDARIDSTPVDVSCVTILKKVKIPKDCTTFAKLVTFVSKYLQVGDTVLYNDTVRTVVHFSDGIVWLKNEHPISEPPNFSK